MREESLQNVLESMQQTIQVVYTHWQMHECEPPGVLQENAAQGHELNKQVQQQCHDPARQPMPHNPLQLCVMSLIWACSALLRQRLALDDFLTRFLSFHA